MLAFLPALMHTGLPAGADIAAHFWRVFELKSQWADGVLFPRWAEHFYYGYGAPTFQYTASGFYVIAGIISHIPLIDDVLALKITWFIGIYVGTCGIYTYAHRRWGVMGGLVSATAFTFAPALIGNEALGRGAFPVVWGMGWLVMSLALLDRFGHTRKGIGWSIWALFAMLWSHNLTAISGAGVLMTWLVFVMIFQRQSHPYRRGMMSIFIIGIMTSAFFWIPVLLERGFVSLDAIPYNPHMRYQDHFYSLGQLLDIIQPYDFSLDIQPERFTLGMVTWVSAISLTLLSLYKWASARPDNLPDDAHLDMIYHAPTHRSQGLSESLFWLILTLGLLFLVLPQSQFLWDNIEMLQNFVFPARFLNITALGLAMLLGAGISTIRYRWIGALLMALLIVQGWHSTVIRWRDDFPAEATARDYLYYEFETNDLATTSANEFKPRSVPNLPPATGFLVESLINGTPAMRVNPEAYGEGVFFTPIKSTAEAYILKITSDIDLSLEIFQFYFVGWTATLDDTPMSIAPSGDFGFIRTDIIPAGTHILRLHYDLTHIQTFGCVLSIIAFIITLIWMMVNNPNHILSKPLKHDRLAAYIQPAGNPLLVVSLALIFVIPLVIVVMREGVAWVY